MIFNYIRTALRVFLRQRTYSTINLVGLALGLAVCILILLWIQNEISYDRFHQNYPNIYRLMSYGTRYMTEGYEGGPGPLAPAIDGRIPGLIDQVRFYGIERTVMQYGDQSYYENRIVLTDPSIFDIFSFPLKYGDHATALRDPYSVVITEEIARKYFGDEYPLGKVLATRDGDFKVSGVLQSLPANSHLQFDFLLPVHLLDELGLELYWGNFGYVTYMLLDPAAVPAEVAARTTEIAAENNCPQVKEGVQFHLQPLQDIHLDADHGGYLSYTDLGDRRYVLLFTIIAAFLLILACVNYINLATARSEKRAREVGVRKAVGATRGHLVKQFIGESTLMALIALSVALVLAELLLPAFNTLVQKQLDFDLLGNTQLLLGLAAIVFITGILAGAYPALFLSSFQAVRTLKSTPAIPGKGGLLNLRRGLVVFQFALSVLLIASTLIIYRQLSYLQTRKLGFNQENVVYLPLKDNLADKYAVVKEELLQHPGILSVAAQDYLWATQNNRTTGYDWEGRDPEYHVDMLNARVDYDYVKTLQLQMVKGRDFSTQFETDGSSAFIINEEAARTMRLEEPVGKHFAIYNQRGVIREGTIVGVYKNINFKSLHQAIEPQVVRVLNDAATATSYGVVLIRVTGEDIPASLAYIENVWKKFNPAIPFEIHFLDETYENLYWFEANLSRMLNYFTALAIIISCLGLFGLASFSAERRTKEIGIRKVLGASISSLIALLTREFILLIGVANLIAWPIAWFIAERWLDHFAYHIDLGLGIFLLAGCLSLVIVLLTISFQAFKAGMSDPVKSLRYE